MCPLCKVASGGAGLFSVDLQEHIATARCNGYHVAVASCNWRLYTTKFDPLFETDGLYGRDDTRLMKGDPLGTYLIDICYFCGDSIHGSTPLPPPRAVRPVQLCVLVA